MNPKEIKLMSGLDMPEWLEYGILIYGPRKGGTTLLQNLLDGGDEVFVYPTELKLKKLLHSGITNQAEANQKYYQTSMVLGREFPNFDSQGYKQYVEKLLGTKANSLYQQICQDVFGVFSYISTAETVHPRMWAIKEVGGNATAIVGAWRNLSYKNRIVMILREPVMVTRSVILERKRRDVRLSMMEIFKEVLDPIRNFYQQFDVMHDPDVYTIMYEHLVDNPSQVMHGITQFLGINYSECFEYPSIYGEKVVTRTASKKEAKVFKSDKKWHEDLSLREMALVFFISKTLTMLYGFRRKNAGKVVPVYSDLLAGKNLVNGQD